MNPPTTDDVDTRTRIIEVATRRFAERGYDATSLREIAEELGITKAAVYYHFPSKEDILAAVLEPLSELVERTLDVVGDVITSDDPLAAWQTSLEAWIELLVTVREQMAVFGRNHHAASFALTVDPHGSEEHAADHRALDQLWMLETIPLSDRIRMAGSVAMIAGFDDWAPALLSNVEPDILETELKALLADVLGRSADR